LSMVCGPSDPMPSLWAVRLPFATTLLQRSRTLHVAVHTNISGYARPQYGSAAAGENQEQPHHPHSVLGYQNWRGVGGNTLAAWGPPKAQFDGPNKRETGD
jgi:hypothetical protein